MHPVAVAGSGLTLSRDETGKRATRVSGAGVRPAPECGMCPEGRECTAGSGPVRNQREELPLREDLTPVFAG
jgi:hypothetical protein